MPPRTCNRLAVSDFHDGILPPSDDPDSERPQKLEEPGRTSSGRRSRTATIRRSMRTGKGCGSERFGDPVREGA